MAYLTTDLLEDVRFQCRLPDNDPDYTTSRLLKIASQELVSVYTFLIGLREDWFVQEQLTQTLPGQSFYEISPRSFASTLREVKLVNLRNGSAVNLKRYDLEDARGNTPTSAGVATGFYIEDNYLILDAVPADNVWTLLQYIWLKPSKLVLPTDCATLVTNNGGGNWTISSPSPAVTAALGAGSIDIVAKNSPHNTKCFQNVTQASPTTITGVYGNPKAGDYVCPEATNPTIGIPEEFSQLLVLSVAARVFESLSPTDLATTIGKLDRLKEELKAAVSPRVEGAQKQLVSTL